MDELHPVKAAIKSNFIVGNSYTGDEITTLFNNIWDGALGLGSRSPKQAIPLVRKYFATLEITSERVEGIAHPRRKYKIVNLNPMGINGHSANPIPADSNIQRHIKE